MVVNEFEVDEVIEACRIVDPACSFPSTKRNVSWAIIINNRSNDLLMGLVYD
jgi:hypothetical protein